MRHRFFDPTLAALAALAERHHTVMALMDAQNQYSDAQALAATGPSTNVIDHGSQRDIGVGEPMTVMLTVDVALAGTSFNFALQTDSAVGFGTATTPATSATVTVLPAAARMYLPVPATAGTNGIKRYTRLLYTLAAATITVTAELIPSRMMQAENVYPGGFLVD